MKNTGDQSWVANWRSESTSSQRCVIQSSEPDQGFELSVNQRTGFNITLNTTALSAVFFKGPNDALINISGNIPQFDMSINVNSVVLTYRRLDHTLSLYFNGVLLSEASAPAGYVDDVID
jgi:hypothetical protein